MNVSGLVCPVTKQTLDEIAGRLVSRDGLTSYPVNDGVPVLLGPEATSSAPEWPRDTALPQYAEAYSEMEFYNTVGSARAEQIRTSGSIAGIDSVSTQHLFSVAELPESERANFPEPIHLWLCDSIDVASERDCYRHIGPVRGKRVIQVGGSGTTAMLFLLAGASESILLTPMVGEARVALEVSALLGLRDRFRCVVGVAEELPFEDGFADVCYAGGCVHHMRTEVAFGEISRVLRQGGKFSAIEPWRAPGYSIGTKVFGKREANAYCSPLTPERVAPIYQAFASAKCVQHGSLTRYPAIVASKMGIHLSVPKAEWVANIDDTICDCIPFGRRFGSGMALLAEK